MSINSHKSYREVGRTGIFVSRIGLGGAWLGYDSKAGTRSKDLGAETVLHALSQGINLIDTSPLYGESEEIIGTALKEYFRRGGNRTDFVISTKTGTRTRPKDYSYDATISSVEKSLELLGLEYVDFILVHDPEDLAPVFAPHGALDALAVLKEKGKIRFIGLGARPIQMHQTCIHSGIFDLSLTFGDYNLLNQSGRDTILQAAHEKNVGIFNAMVVEYGLLAGQDPYVVSKVRSWSMNTAKVERAHELWQWAQSQNLDLLSVALQFSSRDSRVSAILLGASTPDEIDVDIQAYQRPIPEDVWSTLKSQFGIY